MKDAHKAAAEFFASKPLRLLVVSEDYLEEATMIAEALRKRRVDMEVIVIHDEVMVGQDRLEEAAMEIFRTKEGTIILDGHCRFEALAKLGMVDIREAFKISAPAVQEKTDQKPWEKEAWKSKRGGKFKRR